jgi:alpha-tubulin suppressor-like RCC1 family protein
MGIAGVTALALGATHSLALTADGRVFSWGGGGIGQLGHSDAVNIHKPKEIKVIKLSCWVPDGDVV